jgi:hypothetical protein
VAGPSALGGQEPSGARPPERLGRGLPTNVYGLPVVDERGGRITYSREDLAGLVPAPPRIAGTLPERAPNFTAQAIWGYAAFGSSIGISNLVVASNGPRREIYLGGSLSTFGSNDYWQALTYRGAARGYEQTFVSPYLASGFDGITRIEVGEIDPSPGSEILVARQDGRIEVYALPTKAWIRQIVTASTDLRGLEVANVDGDPASEIVICDPGAIRVYSAGGSLEWQVSGAGGQDLVAGQMDQDPALEIALTDGSVVDAATRTVQWRNAGGFGANVEAADIDGDGREELVAADAWYIVWAYDVDLQLPKWSIPAFLDIGAIHLVDIDADGVIELLMGDGQWGEIHAFNTVTLAEEWQIPNPEHGVTDIATGDVDGDGQVELLWGAGATSTGPDHLYVVNWNTGQTEWSNVHLDGPFLGPERADLDGDGKLELVAATFSSDSGYDSGRILVFDDASRRLRAISPPIVENLSWTGLNDLRLRDVDRDGRFEILVAADRLYDGVIEIYDFTPANSFSLAWTNSTRPYGASFRSVEAADIDGDGALEIVGGVGREHTGADGVFVYAYDYATANEEWHSLQLGGYWDAISGLRVADTDLDGRKDIVAMVEQGDVYIFDGPSKVLEARLPTQGSALQVYGVLAPKITVADMAGDLATYEYQQGSYQETYRQHFVPGTIDGFDRVQGNRYWMGNNGSLRLVSTAGATLWQSASYGLVFGSRTVQPNARSFLAAGSYAIVAFSNSAGFGF